MGIIFPQHRSMRQWQSLFLGKYGFDREDDRGIPTLRMHSMTWFPRQFPYLNYFHWVWHGLDLYQRYVALFGTPDVIHAHTMIYGGLLAWNIQSRYGIPFVITEHCTAYSRGLFAPWEIRLASKAAAQANYRMAVSETFCNELNHFLGSDWHPCPNVVSPQFTDYPLDIKSPSDSAFEFITVAYLTERKGIHNLIRAFARAFKDDSTTYLTIGGDGKEREPLESLAIELGVGDRIAFLGALSREEVCLQMAKADAFVLASRYETFGVVVIEALALGKPVIATRCGGPNSVVREQDGLLVPPEDVEALASAMLKLKDNRHQYDSQEIRNACKARYGESAIAERLRTVYGEICIEHQTRRSRAKLKT